MLAFRSLTIICLAAAFEASAAAPPRWRTDNHGERLPPGALARLGKINGKTMPLGKVVFLPGGQSLLSVDGRTVSRWDARTGKRRSTDLYRDHALDVSPDGKLLFENRKGKHWLGEPERGTELLATGSGYPPTALFSRNGKWLVLSSNFQVVQLHDATTGKLIRRIAGIDRNGEKYLVPLGFSSDGRRLACARMAATGSRRNWYNPITGKYLGDIRLEAICVLDSSTGGDLYQIRIHASEASFSSIERHLTDFNSGTKDRLPALRLFHPTSTRLTRPIILQPAEDFNEFSVSPDGRHVACRVNRTLVALFEVASGKEICRFPRRNGASDRPSFSSYAHSSMAFSPDGRRLFTRTDDHTGLVWDVTGRAWEGLFRESAPTAREFNALWRDLASDDAVVANRAVWALVACPERSVPFLAGRVSITPRRASLDRLVGDLGSDRLQTRQNAFATLEKLGDEAQPAFERALASKPDFEVYSRIERLLQQVDKPLSNTDRLRELRAVHVLEQIGTSSARTVLRKLEGQGSGTRLGMEAKLALSRLVPRSG